MDGLYFINTAGDQVFYLQWLIEDPQAVVVISHGMVEHPARYHALASFLNENGVAVYGIYHIGHGKDAKILNHMEKGDFDKCISNLHELVQLIRQKINAPVILLGHSMGSFMSQLYITRYDDLDALILSGSTKANLMTKAGSVLARVMNAVSRNRSKPSKFMNAMAFGAYNKAFNNPKTNFDWLSRDEEQVEKYIKDPYCGGVCSISFFQNLTSGMASMGKKKYIKNINRELPIYIQGGSMDPVSDMGKGLYALKAQYDALRVNHVELDVYEGARHEIFNELNREEVYQNTLKFILCVQNHGNRKDVHL